jgi:hypothetical protein
MVNYQLASLSILYPEILSNDNSPFTLKIYTNALNPVIDLPTISELISFVPS